MAKHKRVPQTTTVEDAKAEIESLCDERRQLPGDVLMNAALLSFTASDVVVLGQGMQGYFLTGTGDTVDQDISRSTPMVGQVNAYNPARSSLSSGGTSCTFVSPTRRGYTA